MSLPALKINSNIYHESIHKAYDWAGNVTDQAIWTPPAGYKIVVTDIYISFETLGAIVIFDETNNLTNRIARDYFADNAGSNKAMGQRFPLSAVNNSVKVTTSGGGTGSLIIYGFVEQ